MSRSAASRSHVTQLRLATWCAKSNSRKRNDQIYSHHWYMNKWMFQTMATTSVWNAADNMPKVTSQCGISFYGIGQNLCRGLIYKWVCEDNRKGERRVNGDTTENMPSTDPWIRDALVRRTRRSGMCLRFLRASSFLWRPTILQIGQQECTCCAPLYNNKLSQMDHEQSDHNSSSQRIKIIQICMQKNVLLRD